MSDFYDVWFPLNIISPISYFLIDSSIGGSWCWDHFWIMSTILVLSSWLLNIFAIPARYRNYEPHSRGIPSLGLITLPKVQSKADKILLVCSAASCVPLKDKSGCLRSLTGLLIIFLIGVAIHEVCDFCYLSILPLRIFSTCLTLSRSLNCLYMIWFLLPRWEWCVGKVSVKFDMVLDDEFLSYVLEEFPNDIVLIFDLV